jgi:NADH-ubiquinone oxidoreductase chain 5
MEGPTPVSALIHAATLVTAGVFLIIRCSIIFETSSYVLSMLALLGASTSFFAASVGLVQNDLKKIIAYSTCSQLGYMIFACGLSEYSVALFHLANHAVFKALLFLSAGCIIHGLNDDQDIRRYGGIIRMFPVSYIMILKGSLALTGFPFLTGFYSKDVILEIAAAKHSPIGYFCHTLGCLAALFTSFYSFRLLFLVFINPSTSYKTYVSNAHEAPVNMIIPLLVLGFGSLVVGFFGKDLVIGLGTTSFQNTIFTSVNHMTIVDSEFLSSLIKNVPFLFTILGCLLACVIVYNSKSLSTVAIFHYKTSDAFRK